MTKCRIHPYEPDIGVCAPCLRDRLLAVIAARNGHRSPEPALPPPPPPRSVSPHFIHRDQRFFSTPQVDLAAAKKKRFSLLSLFRSKPISRTRILGFFSGRSNREMSPVRGDDDDDDDEEESESPTGWRRPEPTPVRRFPAASPARGGIGVAGFAMCLSPLLRPSPKPSAEIGFSACDPRDGGGSVFRRHRRKASAGEASLGPNRSRKLADMGRFR